MNTYYKYAPNVWLAKCPEPHTKGEIIGIANKYGKEAEHEVHNLIAQKEGFYYYSVVRLGPSHAERRAERLSGYAEAAEKRSHAAYEAAQEGREFLSLGEPIKIGHHSERRHRALIERNNNRMRRCVEESEKAKIHASKAEYWERKQEEINISMPESVEHFAAELEKARAYHAGLKNKTIPAEHSYSLTYAKKKVNELEKLEAMARKLWA